MTLFRSILRRGGNRAQREDGGDGMSQLEAVTDVWRSAHSRFSDRKSTSLNSSHTEIYTLSLHDALPIYPSSRRKSRSARGWRRWHVAARSGHGRLAIGAFSVLRSEEHKSELQSHRDLHSFPT